MGNEATSGFIRVAAIDGVLDKSKANVLFEVKALNERESGEFEYVALVRVPSLDMSRPSAAALAVRIDSDLMFRAITGDVAAGVSSLAPFGAGNPRPVFSARRVEIIDGPRKLKERHLKMSLKQDGRIFRAIAWRATCCPSGAAARSTRATACYFSSRRPPMRSATSSPITARSPSAAGR